ncbi:MAG: hypothetical protein O7H41_03850 [Planctomycetota bacterium]|nr:hypothetical protein [Planctomycetota bacterium]
MPRKKRRRRRGTPLCERPKEAAAPKEVWSFDFVHDWTEYGRKLKMLTFVDEYTRECLEIRVEKRMRSRDVLETLDECLDEELFWSRGEAQVIADRFRKVYNSFPATPVPGTENAHRSGDGPGGLAPMGEMNGHARN